MDQAKIGSFIVGKRKYLGMTQRQLAEKLGVSDKSVSKWERGVCLPDVSLYQSLCSELGITINEFFAGEEIEKSQVEVKSEENIISVARDSRDRRTKLKRIIMLLTVLAALLAAGVGYTVHFISEKGYLMNNYVRPYQLSETEYNLIGNVVPEGSTASLLSYKVDKSYHSLSVSVKTLNREGSCQKRRSLKRSCRTKMTWREALYS